MQLLRALARTPTSTFIWTMSRPRDVQPVDALRPDIDDARSSMMIQDTGGEGLDNVSNGPTWPPDPHRWARCLAGWQSS